MKPVLVLTEPDRFSASARLRLESTFDVAEGPFDRRGLLEALPQASAVFLRLAHRIDAEAIEVASNLRAIATPTTGLDHIDLDAAKRRSVAIVSLKGEREFLRSIPATAEHTWALLLALVRRIPQAHAHVVSGGWDRDLFHGHDLAGKRLGIVGLGRIGEKVARYGAAFGMKVSAFDPLRESWPPGVVRAADLRALAAGSDVLSIHVPLEAGTRRLVGESVLRALPKGSIVLNTSRGGVLDEDALLAALRDRHLGGAALDVLQHEETGERPRAQLLEWARSFGNLLITPHIGGATTESMAATEGFIADKLVALFRALPDRA